MLSGSAARTPFFASGRRVDSTPVAANGCCFSKALQNISGDIPKPSKVILKSRYPQLAEICWPHDSGSDEAVRKVQEIACSVGNISKQVCDDRTAQLDEIRNTYYTEAIFCEEGVALTVSKNDPR